MPTTPSPYLLLFRDAGPSLYETLSPEQKQRLLNQWNAWYDRLAREGKVQGGHPLEPEGRIVTTRGDHVVDGPFAETKEAIGGYFLLAVGSLGEATEIAKQCPSLPYGLTVEVRPVAETCPVLRAAQQEAPQEPAQV